MKKIMLGFTILFCSNTHPMIKALATAVVASQDKSITVQLPPQTNTQPPIHVTVNNNISQKQTDNAKHEITNTPTHIQTNQQQVTQANNQDVSQTTIASIRNEIKNSINERAQQIKDQLISLKEWSKENKYKLIIACACSAYAVLFAYLVRGNLRMQDEALWARWRIEDSFEQLASIPHKQLAQDLVFTIQRRYTTETQFTDFIRPLTQFLHDVGQEKKLLKNYLAAGRWIMRLRLDYILPINQKKMELAQKLLQRLCFIEHVFLSWAAEFKIQQNTATS
jgi:hypothetical protein